jgi:hypothetical protein
MTTAIQILNSFEDLDISSYHLLYDTIILQEVQFYIFGL